MSSPTKPTTSIEDLPPEMICELFEHLHPKDLTACSMVNKRWHSIYAGFKVHRLVVMDFYSADYDLSKWHDSNQTIREEERCSTELFRRLAEKPLLSNLKYLALSSRSSQLDLNMLNRFRRLVHLEIKCGWLGQRRMHLNLSRLKVLVFHYYVDSPLSIDCPQLSTLLYCSDTEDPNRFDLKHPETIRKLETNWFGPKLAPFKNVDCLVTWESRAISKATLLSLPRLRELHYDVNAGDLFNEDIDGSFSEFHDGVDRMKRTLSEFLDDAKKLRVCDFQFRFVGFRLTKTMLDQIDFGVRVDEGSGERVCNEYVYLKNYQLIEPGALPFVYQVDYTRLLSNVTGEFPRCFPQKFTDIKTVYAEGAVKDEKHFLRFLKSLRSLRALVLVGPGLSQEFYDQLPACTHSLAELKLRDDNCELKLNFDFIGKLSCLSELDIDPPLSFESLTSLVRWLGKLDEVNFDVRSEEGRFWIWKGRCTEWQIAKPGQSLFETENPEQMLNFFEGLQIGKAGNNPSI